MDAISASRILRPGDPTQLRISRLLRHDPPRRRDRAGGRHRPDRERYPGVQAGWPVLRFELAIGFRVEVSLHVADGKQEANLRADAEHARLLRVICLSPQRRRGSAQRSDVSFRANAMQIRPGSEFRSHLCQQDHAGIVLFRTSLKAARGCRHGPDLWDSAAGFSKDFRHTPCDTRPRIGPIPQSRKGWRSRLPLQDYRRRTEARAWPATAAAYEDGGTGGRRERYEMPCAACAR